MLPICSIFVLNYGEIKCNPERFSNIEPFIDKQNWDGINYALKIDDQKTSEKNNSTTAVRVEISLPKNTQSFLFVSMIASQV